MTGSFRFDRFRLDLGDRQLRDGNQAVELNSRYFDALALLVREQGRLVSKDRFLDEVWSGVPVTDEALTQCIKTLRRQLGDDAAKPRFIETVPKHGYRFIAPVETGGEGPASREPAAPSPLRQFLLLGLAGTAGGGIAGAIGGLVYGFAAQPGVGALSALLVLASLTILVGLVGAAGVSFGISGAAFLTGRLGPWSIAGGALGGLLVGAFAKLLGLDAFTLLFGRSPGDITGAAEGVILGTAVGLGAWLGFRQPSLKRSAAVAAVAGAVAGVLIPLLGGHLMGGSLALLAEHFPGSRLQLDRMGSLLGETGFGPLTQLVTGALEASVFAACVAGAMAKAQGRLERTASH